MTFLIIVLNIQIHSLNIISELQMRLIITVNTNKPQVFAEEEPKYKLELTYDNEDRSREQLRLANKKRNLRLANEMDMIFFFQYSGSTHT